MHVIWSPEQARNYLIQHHKLDRFHFQSGALESLIKSLHCIQQDPLNPCGRNQDLVALARLPEYRNGEIDNLLPGGALDFYAKERCLIEPQAAQHIPNCLDENWGSLKTRSQRVGQDVLGQVLAEIAEKGPISVNDLSEKSRVQPINWSGWKGTAKGQRMAAEILWQQAKIATHSQVNSNRIYDVWEKLFPKKEGDVRTSMTWLLKRRVQACGLMSLSMGPTWGLLKKARELEIHKDLIESGELQLVQVEGSTRKYLAPKQAIRFKKIVGTRILGPLDPLIWDRKLIRHIFQFRYIWEVYKPEKLREWGWYVLPILQDGWLVGRIEVVRAKKLTVKNVWVEKPLHMDGLQQELKRLATANGLALNGIRKSSIHTSKATDLT